MEERDGRGAGGGTASPTSAPGGKDGGAGFGRESGRGDRGEGGRGSDMMSEAFEAVYRTMNFKDECGGRQRFVDAEGGGVATLDLCFG